MRIEEIFYNPKLNEIRILVDNIGENICVECEDGEAYYASIPVAASKLQQYNMTCEFLDLCGFYYIGDV